MQDEALLRYSRHILLDEWGIEAQQAVLEAKVLIIGAGGLGCPAAMYLTAAGVGHLTIMDGDAVDLTNLQRQIGHTTGSVGQAKVQSLSDNLVRLNPGTHVYTVAAYADEALLEMHVPEADVVLDCTDHFAIRQLINRVCVKHGVPLVSGAAMRFDGQISTYDFRREASPCYACVFPPEPAPEEVSCSTMGVFSPTVGIIGTMQAADALKLITGMGKPLVGRLMMLDSLSMQWGEIRTSRQADCSVCRSLRFKTDSNDQTRP